MRSIGRDLRRNRFRGQMTAATNTSGENTDDMVVLLDTNVIFDVADKRQPHYLASNQILCLCRRNVLVGVVAFHTIANCFYEYGRPIVPFIRDRLLRDVQVAGGSSNSILDAIGWGMRDLEDALQAAAALNAGAS